MSMMVSKSEIKYIQSLRDKKLTTTEREYAVEGRKIVAEYLDEIPDRVLRIFALKNWIEEQRFLPDHILVSEVSPQELKKLSFLSTPGEVIALVRTHQVSLGDMQSKGITILLDQVQDPGNMGTIMRTCDWFGVQQIVCTPGTVSPFNPKALQATMGSDIRIKMAQSEPDIFFEKFSGIPVYAAALEGSSVYEIVPAENCVLVIGNESKGISEKVFGFCTAAITIPRFGKAESLNAAIANAVILSHFRAKLI